jgi:predicted DNA-binding transcriptional regulator AlpA
MSQTIISRKRVLERVPYSAAHLARLEKAGLFPRRVKWPAAGFVDTKIRS